MWFRPCRLPFQQALHTVDPSRPLHARIASDNVASHRVLEKCGFRAIATERSFGEARSGEIEEFVLRLEESGPLEVPSTPQHSRLCRQQIR